MYVIFTFIKTLHTVSIIVVVITHPFGFMLMTIHDFFQDSVKHKHATSSAKLSNQYSDTKCI